MALLGSAATFLAPAGLADFDLFAGTLAAGSSFDFELCYELLDLTLSPDPLDSDLVFTMIFPGLYLSVFLFSKSMFI